MLPITALLFAFSHPAHAESSAACASCDVGLEQPVGLHLLQVSLTIKSDNLTFNRSHKSLEVITTEETIADGVVSTKDQLTDGALTSLVHEGYPNSNKSDSTKAGTNKCQFVFWVFAIVPLAMLAGSGDGNVISSLPSHMVSAMVTAVYIVVSVSIDLVIMMQKTGNDYSFNPLCSIILTEFVKLVFSIGAYLWHLRGEKCQWLQGFTLSDVRWMCLPAFLYTLNNYMVFVAIGKNNAATFGAFRDTMILWTAAIWYFVFQTPLKGVRILGIVTIVVGLWLNRMSGASQGAASRWAVLMVVLMTLCNSVGGVANEYALKRNAGLDINLQNAILYVLCFAMTFAFLAFTDVRKLSSPHEFFKGFTNQTALMIALQATAGLLVSRLLKYADAIYKSAGTALRGPVLVFIAPFIVASESFKGVTSLLSAVCVLPVEALCTLARDL